MWLTVLITLVLVVVVFGFVLEPILRGRADRTELDSVSIPDTLDAVELDEGEPAAGIRSEALAPPKGEYATEAGRAEPGS